MNTKRIAQFLNGLGALAVSIGLQINSSAQNSLDSCTSRNSVAKVFGSNLENCNTTTISWFAVMGGIVILLVGVVMSVGHSARTREWVLVWGALATWAIGVRILYL